MKKAVSRFRFRLSNPIVGVRRSFYQSSRARRCSFWSVLLVSPELLVVAVGLWRNKKITLSQPQMPELKCVHFDTKNFSNSRSSSNLGHNRETNRCGSALIRSMKALQASKRWRMEA